MKQICRAQQSRVKSKDTAWDPVFASGLFLSLLDLCLWLSEMILSFYFASLGCTTYLPLKSYTNLQKSCGDTRISRNVRQDLRFSYACNFYQMIFEITRLGN